MLSRDEQAIFVPEGEGWARNSGLWVQFKTHNSKSHDDETRENLFKHKKQDENQSSQWTQPQLVNRLVKVWLANAKERASGGDPLDFVYKHTWHSMTNVSCDLRCFGFRVRKAPPKNSVTIQIMPGQGIRAASIIKSIPSAPGAEMAAD